MNASVQECYRSIQNCQNVLAAVLAQLEALAPEGSIGQFGSSKSDYYRAQVIMATVSQSSGVDSRAIRGRTRGSSAVKARLACYQLLKEFTLLSGVETARFMHKTNYCATSGIAASKNWAETNSHYREWLDLLRTQIRKILDETKKTNV